MEHAGAPRFEVRLIGQSYPTVTLRQHIPSSLCLNAACFCPYCQGKVAARLEQEFPLILGTYAQLPDFAKLEAAQKKQMHGLPEQTHLPSRLVGYHCQAACY